MGISAFVMVAAHAAKGTPDAGFELVETTYSPQRTFQIEHCFYRGTNRPSCYWQHWITDDERPHKRTLLYESDEAIDTLISPDDSWIVLNDRRGSDDMVALLFRKSNGMRVNAMTNIDLKAEAFRAAALQQGFAASQMFDHGYCEALCWLGPHSLVLHAWGHMSGGALLNDWYCIYDIKNKQVHFDLSSINKGAFERKSRQ